MDDVDLAQQHEQQLRELARRNIPGAVKVASAHIFRECEEPIPEKRRKAVPGVQLCIECQRELERRT